MYITLSHTQCIKKQGKKLFNLSINLLNQSFILTKLNEGTIRESYTNNRRVLHKVKQFQST